MRKFLLIIFYTLLLSISSFLTWTSVSTVFDFGYTLSNLFRLRERVHVDHNTEQEIVIVGIDDKTIESIPQTYRGWAPDHYKHLIRNLTKAGARLVAFYPIFGLTNLHYDATKRELHQNLTGPIVSSPEARGKKPILFSEINTASRYIGKMGSFKDPEEDAPVDVRLARGINDFVSLYPINPLFSSAVGFYPVKNVDEIPNPTFELEIVEKLLNIDKDAAIVEEDNFLIRDELVIPYAVEFSNFALINYHSAIAGSMRPASIDTVAQDSKPQGLFNIYSLSDMIDDEDFELATGYDKNVFQKIKNSRELQNKIVLVGYISNPKYDTPFGQMSAVEIGAHAIKSMLDNDYVYPLSKKYRLLSFVFLLAVSAFILQRLGPFLGSLTFYAVVIFYGLLAIYMFIQRNILMDVMLPISTVILFYLGTIIYKFSTERMKSRQLKLDFLEKEREFELARELQESMLPVESPHIEGYEIAARMIPAKEVGGDFYDFIDLGDGKLGVLIGDVAGKGITGAMLMAECRMAFKILSEKQTTPAKFMCELNKLLSKEMKRGMSISFLYSILDLNKGTMIYANAGLVDPVVVKPGKRNKVNFSVAGGERFPLGIVEQCIYNEEMIELEYGDLVFFYTDGVVEAMDKKRKLFGFPRLENVLSRLKNGFKTDDVIEKVLKDIDKFSGKLKHEDDITIVTIKRDKP